MKLSRAHCRHLLVLPALLLLAGLWFRYLVNKFWLRLTRVQNVTRLKIRTMPFKIIEPDIRKMKRDPSALYYEKDK